MLVNSISIFLNLESPVNFHLVSKFVAVCYTLSDPVNVGYCGQTKVHVMSWATCVANNNREYFSRKLFLVCSVNELILYWSHSSWVRNDQ